MAIETSMYAGSDSNNSWPLSQTSKLDTSFIIHGLVKSATYYPLTIQNSGGYLWASALLHFLKNEEKEFFVCNKTYLDELAVGEDLKFFTSYGYPYCCYSDNSKFDKENSLAGLINFEFIVLYEDLVKHTSFVYNSVSKTKRLTKVRYDVPVVFIHPYISTAAGKIYYEEPLLYWQNALEPRKDTTTLAIKPRETSANNYKQWSFPVLPANLQDEESLNTLHYRLKLLFKNFLKLTPKHIDFIFSNDIIRGDDLNDINFYE